VTVLEKPRVSTTPSPWQDPARLGAIYPSTEFVGHPKTPSQDDHLAPGTPTSALVYHVPRSHVAVLSH